MIFEYSPVIDLDSVIIVKVDKSPRLCHYCCNVVGSQKEERIKDTGAILSDCVLHRCTVKIIAGRVYISLTNNNVAGNGHNRFYFRAIIFDVTAAERKRERKKLHTEAALLTTVSPRRRNIKGLKRSGINATDILYKSSHAPSRRRIRMHEQSGRAPG